ncbi:uncharacterized protein LOC109851002 isoform X2 [Asparagus officinalis]|uniref:uncharacterized protein LOC109851002 isoform X2 n=1 Tax=Asparagus officinalis TaxID=4686 RepID=UPI00098E4990|nr:uncharacterized protein LOC109851002 isoform X2 [Asparagus officinalis]
MELRQNRTGISKRIPLSNLTNAQSLSPSSSSALTLKPKPKPKPLDPRSALSSSSKLAYVSDSRSSSSISSGRLKNPSHRRTPNSDRPAKDKSSDLGAINSDKSKSSVVHARKKTEGIRDKGKVSAASGAFSHPSGERVRTTGGKFQAGSKGVSMVSTSSIPYKKSKKIQQNIILDDEVLPQSSMSQDYIERQRAYFAEIDAYDLAEEVVSESELE